jgi:hypothetical protein
MLSAVLSCLIILLGSCNHAPTKNYTGSTPANAAVVRDFLNIPRTDSVDFIRWKLQLNNGEFQLICNYGIGKPNTNGFYNGGKAIQLKGKFIALGNDIILQNAGKSLRMVELNEDLLHIADNSEHLLVGTGGWSYTLNTLSPLHSSHVNLKANMGTVTDSLVYVGRTPCGVPGVVEPGKECYKLKWKIIFYPISNTLHYGRYKILSTAYRTQIGKTGTWRLIHGKDDRIIIEMNNDEETNYIYLVKLDEEVLIFSDGEGKLLVGNEDFSYTINRVH